MLFAVSWNLEDPFSREKYKKFTMVTKIHPHPKYRTNAFELWYDAAILEIHQALTPAMGAIPICLPPPNFKVFKNPQKCLILNFHAKNYMKMLLLFCGAKIQIFQLAPFVKF